MSKNLEDADISWIENLIHSYIDTSPQNTLGGSEIEKAFDTPLVGFCRGDDPLFAEYKSVIGSFHRTPPEVFNSVYPDADAAASDLAVITWILPQTEKTKRDNRSQDLYPAERWARGRMFGEQTNNGLRRYVVDALLSRGIPGVAPVLTPGFESKLYPGCGWASTWSERHAAFAAGLGTFGLCDGLITPLGKAMRVGSVVARMRVAAGRRPYSDRHAYCLFLTGRGCGECIRRCPAGALGPGGHDKDKCRAHTFKVCGPYIEEQYGFEGHGCGLCQTGVPCESGIPVA
ncbi:MAG: (Fe-S)-binding protein [Spirochaetaceae bacterium]|nr:MAG: (Fe-S)-binding protein [Spirochaetaceae bacterium]